MHGLDIAALCLGGLFILLGIKRGLITELFRLAAMIGGFSAAALYYRQLYTRLSFLPFGDSLRLVIAFLCVYVLAAAALLGIGWLVKKIVHWTLLGWIDRLLGGVIGLLKAGLVVWILTLILSALPLPAVHDWMNTSIVVSLLNLLPPRIKLPDIDQAQTKILQALDKDSFDTYENTVKKIDQFRTRIDSLAPRDTI